MIKRIIEAGIALVLWSTTTINAQWTVDFKTGLPYNFPLPMEISQENYPDLSVSPAKFYSEPFVLPIVWYLRLGRWDGDRSWEAEFFHHKLYLDNKPEEIQEFSITHGYNQFLINRAWKVKSFILRAGMGISLVHPESVIRGNRFDESGGISGSGYYIGGVALQGSVEKRFRISDQIYFSGEGRINPTFSKVPVYTGEAKVWTLTFHLTAGLGFIF